MMFPPNILEMTYAFYEGGEGRAVTQLKVAIRLELNNT